MNWLTNLFRGQPQQRVIKEPVYERKETVIVTENQDNDFPEENVEPQDDNEDTPKEQPVPEDGAQDMLNEGGHQW